jgi:hypothetical protein
MNTAHLRIVQSTISTRALQGLLVAIVLCASLQVITMDFDGVLPKNPCSIAAVASLLNGSEVIELISEGSEIVTDEQLEQCFEDQVFSLGYHGGRFGIDVGEAEKLEENGSQRTTSLHEWIEKVKWTKVPTGTETKAF